MEMEMENVDSMSGSIESASSKNDSSSRISGGGSPKVEDRDVKAMKSIKKLESWEEEYMEVNKGVVSFKIPRDIIDKDTKRRMQSATDIAGIKAYIKIKSEVLSIVMPYGMYEHLKQFRNSVESKQDI